MNTSQTISQEKQPTFFDFAAEVGLTKHIGGLEATETLLQLCQITTNSYILDVGCGVGASACFIARQVGCRVMGVDIMPKMVKRYMQSSARDVNARRKLLAPGAWTGF